MIVAGVTQLVEIQPVRIEHAVMLLTDGSAHESGTDCRGEQDIATSPCAAPPLAVRTDGTMIADHPAGRSTSSVIATSAGAVAAWSTAAATESARR